MPRTISCLIGAFSLVLALLPSAALAQAPAERTFTYEVRTRGDVRSDVGAFSHHAAHTLSDKRGWSLGGSLRYREVQSGGDFTLWLASADQMESFSSVCSPDWSCRVGRNVVINDRRWREATPTWPYSLDEYRHYVVTHEMGHWHGLGHVGCPGSNQPAPVMMQGSKGFGGCVARVWPLRYEREAVARNQGVSVRRGRADVAWYEQWKGGSVTVARSTGASFVGDGEWVGGWGQPDRAALGDVDGDGEDDLVWYEAWKSGGTVTVALSTGSSFVVPRSWISGWGHPDWMGVSDVNGDGLDDLAWYEAWKDGGTVTVALSDGSRFVDAGAWVSGWSNPSWAGVGDVNGDGRADLVWHEAWNAQGSVTVGLSTGSRFAWNGRWAEGWGGPNLAFVGDTDGDGQADLVWYESWNAQGSVTVGLSTGSRFAWNGRWAEGWGGPTRAHVGDADGDGRADLLWYEAWNNNGSITVGRSTGDRFAWNGRWLSGWGRPDWSDVGSVTFR